MCASICAELCLLIGKSEIADEKPLSDVWMLNVAVPAPVMPPKEPKSHKKKDTAGLKMITSYNLFCEHRRPEVRQAHPDIVPR